MPLTPEQQKAIDAANHYVKKLNKIDPATSYARGDVFQIIDDSNGPGWMGAFVIATEIKSWGIVYFYQVVNDRTASGTAYVRLKWPQIEFVGVSRLPLTEDV